MVFFEDAQYEDVFPTGVGMNPISCWLFQREQGEVGNIFSSVYGKRKKAALSCSLFSKLTPGTNPLWVSGEVFIITSCNQWRPQGDLNPCRRRERPLSWAG